jgi:DNA-binding beta-propeller fold protein YncE
MKWGTVGLLQFLILLIASLSSVSSSVAYLETDESSQQSLEATGKKEVFADKGFSVKFLFAIEGFSEEQKFAAPMGVFYDKYHDEIYVADTGNDRVDIFDADGQSRFQIRRVQGLKTPLDVVVSRENQIYVSQMEINYLQLFDFRGRHVRNLYAPNVAPFKPGRMCLDVEGKLYVVDRERAKILVYDADGNYQFQFGGKGEGEGKFRLISGVDVDSAGRIYVADSKQIPIQVFDSNGQFLLSFGSHGHRGGDFSFLGGICIDEKDRIWIADTFRHQVKVFRTDGSFLFQFGTFGTEIGQFFFPIDLALDEHGRVYILEKGANRLQVFEIHGW